MDKITETMVFKTMEIRSGRTAISERQETNRWALGFPSLMSWEFFQAKTHREKLRPTPGHSQSLGDLVRPKQLNLTEQNTRNESSSRKGHSQRDTQRVPLKYWTENMWMNKLHEGGKRTIQKVNGNSIQQAQRAKISASFSWPDWKNS